MLKYSLQTMGISGVVFIVSVILHNSISAILGVEEPVFFLIAVVVAPLAFVVGAVGSAVLLLRRLFTRA